MVPFVYTNGELTLILNGKPVLVAKDHPAFNLIKKELPTASVSRMLELVSRENVVKNFVTTAATNGRAEVRNGQVYLDGKAVHNTVTQRIMEFISAGLPIDSLLRFLERVSQNPSYRAQQELFDFLQNKKLPLTEDGCFLGYKAVGSDWYDKFEHKYRNKPGDKPEMKRSEVDDDRTNECSRGLHVGGIEYVYQYGNPEAGDHIVVVKVDPANVVSVPKDCNFQKLRTWTYEVMYEFQGELPKPLYNAAASEGYGNDDEDWDEVDEYLDDEEDEEEDCDCPQCLAQRPDGSRYYNRRDSSGRFSR